MKFNKLIIFILCFNYVKAQNNLVLNGGFEQVVGCPNVNLGAITEDYVPNVSNPANYTPDYFNICYYAQGVPYFGVPSNVRGYQIARTGNAYIGLGLWEMGFYGCEYVQFKIYESLKANHHYAFECYLSRAEKFRYAVSNFGAYFSMDSVAMPAADILPFVPQINNPAGNYFTDTLNWMPFTGTFVAQGGEQYVILGNFNTAAESIDTLYQYYGSASHANWAYYYIDDVSLIDLDSTLTVKENEGLRNVEVYPNPAKERITISDVGTNSEVSITDITGNIVVQTKVSAGNEIDVSFFNAGLYFIYIENSKGRYMAKFVKE